MTELECQYSEARDTHGIHEDNAFSSFYNSTEGEYTMAILAKSNISDFDPSKRKIPATKEYFFKLMFDIYRDKFLYLLALPGLLFFLVFKYIPIWGVLISFQNYSPYQGFLHSKWVGLEHFQRFFSHPDFFILFRNTLAISLINLFLFFPLPIVLSLMLNELRSNKLKNTIQSIIYIPHFFSWVLIYSITYLLFASGSGIVNQLLVMAGVDHVEVLTNPKAYWFLLAFQNMWKETGWGTIVILAAIAGIDVSMYEAAKIDGASRLRQIWSITLPSIMNIIVILLVLKLGSIMDVGFEQSFLMTNGAVSNVSEVFDLFSYRLGIQQGQFSFSTAVGLFKSVIGLVLVVLSNRVAKKLGHTGIY